MTGFVRLLQSADPAAAGSLTQLLRTPSDLVPLARAAALVALGLPAAWVVGRWVRGYATRLGNEQKGLIAGKAVFWPLAVVILISVLRELGFSLAPLLGAAGVLGVALGFASQTSVSNLIAGFFLLAEEPFKVGDVIDVEGVVGQVLTIDTLSVKVRTFDNRMVRIPNETLVKSRFTNVTRFPIRRVDTIVGVAYREDLGRVREILLDVAARNPNVLMEPEPLVIFDGYGESSIDFRFAVWARRDSFLLVRNEIGEQVKARFDAEGIEIPFPHRSLYAGSIAEPFPVRVVDGSAAPAQGA